MTLAEERLMGVIMNTPITNDAYFESMFLLLLFIAVVWVLNK